MALSERARDWLITGGFLALIGGLVVLGWDTRDPAYAAVVEGEPAPALTLDRLDGGTASLSDYRGRVVLLNIWATWCGPCVREMPAIQAAYERYRDQGFEVLAVAVDQNPGSPRPDGGVDGPVSDFVDRFGLTFPVLLDPTGGTERLYGVDGLPTTFLIDREGKVRVRELGGRFWDSEPYSTMIEALLEE